MKFNRRTAVLLAVLCLSGCAAEGELPVETAGDTERTENEKQDVSAEAATIQTTITPAEWEKEDTYSDTNGGTIIDLAAVALTEGKFTIAEGGTYRLTGTLADGQLVVEVPKKETVHLIFDNISIYSSSGTPIEVKQGKKVFISLPAGTVNSLGNTAGLVPESEEAAALDIAGILSKCDLTVNGEGMLTVSAASGDGIRSKDVLKVTEATLVITAADRGLVGKDGVLIKDALTEITSCGDGIQSNNGADSGGGYVVMDGGTTKMMSQKDGIQAETLLTVNSGVIDITTGTGSYESTGREDFGGGRSGFFGMFGFGETEDSAEDEESQKGMKAGTALVFHGGTITVNSYDDALHSDGDVTVTDGVLLLSSGDDGIHGEGTVAISGGTVTVQQSYEGIEGCIINISGGVVTVTASDDGLNATDGSGDTMGMFSRGTSGGVGAVYVHIGGGTLTVDARGDGLDSNGTFTIDGGTVTVFGPSDGGNGYVDTAGAFTVNGGEYLGIGTSSMLVTPDASSGQHWIGTTVNGGTGDTIEVKNSAGELFVTATAPRQFNSVTYSSEGIAEGEEYFIYINDTLAATVTTDSSVQGNGMGGGFGRGRGDKPGGGRGERSGEMPGGEPPEGFGGGNPGGFDDKRSEGFPEDFEGRPPI